MSVQEMKSNQNQEKTKSKTPVSEKRKLVQLPLTRVRTIMKMSDEVQNISQDGLYLVTKATEMFIQYLADETKTQTGQKLDYNKLSNIVENNKSLDFLSQYLPKKITFKQFKEIMASKQEIQNINTQDSDLSSNCVFDYSSQDSADENISFLSFTDIN